MFTRRMLAQNCIAMPKSVERCQSTVGLIAAVVNTDIWCDGIEHYNCFRSVIILNTTMRKRHPITSLCQYALTMKAAEHRQMWKFSGRLRRTSDF